MGGLTRVADASGTCSGGEQAEEEDERRKRSCGSKQHWGSSSRSCLYSSVDGFVVGFCQRVWGWCCGAFACTARLLDSSQLRCGKQLLTPDTAWRCESIVPLHSAMQCSACSQRAIPYYVVTNSIPCVTERDHIVVRLPSACRSCRSCNTKTSKSRRNLHITTYLSIQHLFQSGLICKWSALRALHFDPFLTKFGP